MSISSKRLDGKILTIYLSNNKVDACLFVSKGSTKYHSDCKSMEPNHWRKVIIIPMPRNERLQAEVELVPSEEHCTAARACRARGSNTFTSRMLATISYLHILVYLLPPWRQSHGPQAHQQRNASSKSSKILSPTPLQSSNPSPQFQKTSSYIGKLL